MDRYSHVTLDEQAESLNRLPDLLSRTAPSSSNGQELPVDDSVVLADCLARNGAVYEHSVRLRAMIEAIIAAASHTPIDPENAVILANSSIENAMRLAGFEPATYGLGNRCSIP